MLKFIITILVFMHSYVNASTIKNATISVTEKNTSEALVAAVRQSIKKYLSIDPEVYKAIFESEVLPHASQYISSYKVVNSAKGLVSLSVTVDISTLQSMFLLHANQFKKSPVKLLLVVKGFKGGMPWKGIPYETAEEILVSKIESEIKERVIRRKISLLPRLTTYQEHIESLESNSMAMLRALATKTNADLVVFAETKLVEADDDESIIEGTQLQIEMSMYDRTRNLLLASNKDSIPMNAGVTAVSSKNEKIVELINGLIAQNSQDLWRRAGSKLLSEVSSDNYLTLRVHSPPNYAAILELKEAVQKLPKVNSILEREIEHDKIDFWVDSAYSNESIKKELKNLRMKEYKIVLEQQEKEDENEKTAVILSLSRIEEKNEKL